MERDLAFVVGVLQSHPDFRNILDRAQFNRSSAAQPITQQPSPSQVGSDTGSNKELFEVLHEDPSGKWRPVMERSILSPPALVVHSPPGLPNVPPSPIASMLSSHRDRGPSLQPVPHGSSSAQRLGQSVSESRRNGSVSLGTSRTGVHHLASSPTRPISDIDPPSYNPLLHLGYGPSSSSSQHNVIQSYTVGRDATTNCPQYDYDPGDPSGASSYRPTPGQVSHATTYHQSAGSLPTSSREAYTVAEVPGPQGPSSSAGATDFHQPGGGVLAYSGGTFYGSFGLDC